MFNFKSDFWLVFTLVVGSQIGSGILTYPTTLSIYGIYSIFGLAIASVGAICIALVFSKLSSRFSEIGGPHVYIKKAFGDDASFFMAWTYWILSVISTTTLVAVGISYLSAIIGSYGVFTNLMLQLTLLWLITIINLKGVRFAGVVESILTLIKVVPLIIIPAIGLFFFDWKNFEIAKCYSDFPSTDLIAKSALLGLWGFLGIETATAPTGMVKDPKKTIPKAIVIGTIFVAVTYIFNILGVIGTLPGSKLSLSNTPYVDVVSNIFGGNYWGYIMAFIACIMAIGSLNAWILSQGQVIYGASKEKLFHKMFEKVDSKGTPINGLIAGSLLMSVILIITTSDTMSKQINIVIDMSVTCVIFIYAACAIALIKILTKEKSKKITDWSAAIFCLMFCIWIVKSAEFTNILVSFAAILSGAPFYLIKKFFKNRNKSY